MSKKKKLTYEELYQMLKNSGTKPSREDVAKAYNQYDFETEDIAPITMPTVSPVITTGAIDIGVSNAVEIANRKNVFNPIKGYDWMPSREATVDAPIFGSNKVKENVENLMSVYYNKDFPNKSGYVSTKADNFWDKFTSKYGMNYNDLQYEYINNLNGIREEIDKKAMSFGADTGKGASSYKEKALSYMTPDEVAVYNYYYQTEGKEKAQEFLDALAETLNTRKGNKEFESVEGKTAREILMGTVAGTEQFKQGVKNFGNMVAGKDDYIPQTSTQILTGKIREDLADDGVKVLGNSLGQFAYDALSTGTNMVPSIALGAMNPAAGVMLMGAGAAGNAYQQDLNESGDKEKAKAYALAVGTLEGTLQYLLGGIGNLGGTSAAINNAVAGIKNGAIRFLLEYSGKIGSEALEEGLQEILAPIVKNAIHGTNENINWQEVAYASLLGGFMGAVYSGSDVRNTHLNANEHAVVDKVFKDAVKEQETSSGKKLTSKEKKNLYDKVLSDMEKGYINADVIESVLGGENYKNLQTVIEQEQSIQKEYDTAKAEYDEINKLKAMERTGEQEDRRTELKAQLEEIKARQDEFNARDEKSRHRGLLDIDVWNQIKNTKLAETYLEKERKGESYTADLSEYTEKEREIVQSAIDSGVLNNTNRTHDFVNFVARICGAKGITFNFSNNQRIAESGFAIEGKVVNGFVDNGEITLNIQSAKALNTVVGHEITHILEGTELYSELQSAVETYAQTKGDYASKWEEIQQLYSKKTAEEQKRELTADFIGEYLFTDSDFINNLHIEKPNVFKRAYNEIKHLVKFATAGSDEAKQLLEVKKKFEQAMQSELKPIKGDTKYSIVEHFVDNNGTEFESAVLLDTDKFDDVSPRNWGKTLKKIIEERVAKDTFIMPVADEQGNIQNLEFAKKKDYTSKDGGGQHPVLGELYMTSDNISKLSAIHVDEIVEISEEDTPYFSNENRHGWLDKNGWLHRTANVINIKNGNIYQIELDIAKAEDGRIILYALNGKTKRVGNADVNSLVKRGSSLNSNSEVSIPQNAEKSSGKTEIEGITVDTEGNPIAKDVKSETNYSLSNDTAYMDKAIEKNNSSLAIDETIMEEAKVVRERIAKELRRMYEEKKVGLPEDIEGNTFISNSSYGGTEENTTICPRSLAAESFVDAVSEYLGRPLTVEEQIYISQDLQGRSLTPECTYCYVATDRKAYRAFLGEYVNQRDEVTEQLEANPDADVSRNGELYKEFLNGRKDTNPMYNRFKMWVDAYKKGLPMIDASHLANMSKLMGDINSEFGAELKPQIVDAMKYAQSASWAKKRVSYVAYNGHILKWKQDRINKLNAHYGLRMYSFSDFHPAFVLENMQMITDASVRGLKMLGYTKDTDFVEIFAPTGMNINISTFGFEQNGVIAENNLIGADWKKAQKLREQYPNVGITFVATNDALTEWALNQEWIDVVIPFHLVRTGKEVAKAFKYHDYTSESSDSKTSEWTKADKKYIAPTEHNNDLQTYLDALEKNHLKPRFERFVNHPNYMKLVNECRLSASESQAVQPKFNEDAAMRALAKLEANGYYTPIGGTVDRMYEIAGEVAEAMPAGIEEMRKQIGPTYSLGEETAHGGDYRIYGDDIGYAAEETAPVTVDEDIAPVAPEAPIARQTSYSPLTEEEANARDAERNEQDFGPVKPRVAKALTESTKPKKKSRFWSQATELIGDKGFVFENLAKKTKNRELEAKWNSTRYAEGKAQEFIGNGTENVRAINDINAEVQEAGIAQELYDYAYHLLNIDRMTLSDRFGTENKPVYGETVTAEESRRRVKELEASHPELKSYMNELYNINNHLRELLVDGGIITRETANLWEKMYPHYVPIDRAGMEGGMLKEMSIEGIMSETEGTGVNAPVKRATGGNSDMSPLLNTMATRAIQTYKAIARNNFGVELKNTLKSVASQENADVDGVDVSIDQQEDLLQKGRHGKNPTFTVFENGKKVTFEITENMYDALSGTSEFLSHTIKPLNAISQAHRGVLTQYNPAFMARNFAKDTQDVLINSQHPVKTYANFPKSVKELLTKGEWYNEYVANGGDQNTYFQRDASQFKKDKSAFIKLIGSPFNAISQANEFIEKIPRLAEYIASRESGASVDVAMLDAARVTTNFAAGGDLTKFANRNGATFLNATVQGAMQQVRNVREAKMNGLKGWTALATKYAIAGIPMVLLNKILWDDDEEYEDLSDYVKENYYIVAKFGDGEFVRIPKGRMVSVLQNAFEQTMNALTGDDEVDLQSFFQLVVTNLAPNNPIEDNIIAPIAQARANKTWYGDDLVPTRLQDLPKEEQFDETTDSLSKWLGENTGQSPYKINYLLEQYTGGFGDVVLPMMTTAAETSDDSFGGKLLAPLRDSFTTDSVLKNQNVADFYEKSDELKINANSSKATDEDILSNKYVNSISGEMSDLYKEKREIQNSDMTDSEKYYLVRETQKKINALAESALNEYGNVKVDGNHASVGDKQYRLTEEGWTKLTSEQIKKQDEVTNGLGISKGEYWSDKEEYDMQYKYPEKYKVLQEQGISAKEYKEQYEESAFIYTDVFDWASKNSGKYAVSKAISEDVTVYKKYTSELSAIRGDKDSKGNTISGSSKKKKTEYIKNLDIDDGQKAILYRSLFDSKADKQKYNAVIVNYLNSRSDISREDKVAILEELDMVVNDDGSITW